MENISDTLFGASRDTFLREERCLGLKLKWFSCFQYNSPLLAKTEVEM